MAAIKFQRFFGEFPYANERRLVRGAAIKAVDSRLESGVLKAIDGTSSVRASAFTDALSLYRYKPDDGTEQWTEIEEDADFVRWPLGDDEYDRIIYSSSSFTYGPRIVDSGRMGTDHGAPDSYVELGIPAPETAPKATIAGTRTETDDVPDVRYYVITNVNEWGQESAPSPPSNQVEVHTGEYVELSNFPNVPSGAGRFYNVVARRIYRLNVGSNGNAAFQFVAEVQTVADSYQTPTTVSVESPYTTVTFPSAHGFEVGDDLEQNSTIGAQGSTIDIEGVTYGATSTTIDATGHGLSDGDAIQIGLLTDATGAEELSGLKTTIENSTADTFELTKLSGIDTQGYTAWVSGGTFRQSYGLESLVGLYPSVVSVVSDTVVNLNVDTSDDNALDASGSIQFRKAAGSSYDDRVPSGSLGEVLATTLYDPPHPDTQGLKAHPGGFLVGFHSNTVDFSEQGAPHAFPIEYRRATEGNITGLGIFGNYVFVGTENIPYLFFGNAPGAMTKVELPASQACASKRGIVDIGTGVVYPSPDGLILVTQGQPVNLTEGLFTRKQWQAMDPTTMLAFEWEDQYLCFFGDGSATKNAFSINPLDPAQGVVYYSDWATSGYKDLDDDVLYLNINDFIVGWDQSGTPRTGVWRSGKQRMRKPVNFSLARVEAEDYPVALRIVGDGRYAFETTVQDDEIFRLPADMKATDWNVEVSSKYDVISIMLAQSMKEFSVDEE